MGYYIDLEKISIDDYFKKLESAYLPPSRMILKEMVEERSRHFKSLGIKNVKELISLLKKKDTVAKLSKVDCFSDDYLTILLRELNSSLPKPNKIAEFAGISKDTVEKLEKIGINNTEKLYDKVLKKVERQSLSGLTGIKEDEILELTKLADLSRIKWVGVTFARLLYDLGVDTVEKVSKADPVDLHTRLTQMNKEQNLYKGQIGLNDMRILVNAASEVPLEIEYE